MDYTTLIEHTNPLFFVNSQFRFVVVKLNCFFVGEIYSNFSTFKNSCTMKKILLFFISAAILIFVACQKDVVATLSNSSASTSNSMDVAKAKKWFDETEPKTVWDKPEPQKHYKPQWDLAI